MTEPTFDPEVWQTWPFPQSTVINRSGLNGAPRLDLYGEAWCDGFEVALRMADHFHKTGEWVTP